MDILLGILLALALLVIILQAVLGRRSGSHGQQDIGATESRLRETFMTQSQRDRESTENASRALREEIRESLVGNQKVIAEVVGQLGQGQGQRLDQLTRQTSDLLENTKKQLIEIDQRIKQDPVASGGE